MINGETVETLEAPNSGMCWHPHCHTAIEANISDSVLDRVYNKEKENKISVGFQDSSRGNYACLGNLFFELHFEVPDILVSDIHPSAGPESGGTVIAANVSRNIPKGSTLVCIFDRTSVPATDYNNGTIKCVSPSGRLGVVSFFVGLEMLNKTYRSNPGPIFEFYYASSLSKVVPNHGSIRGGTRLSLFGNFKKTGEYTCRFTNETYSTEKRIKDLNDTIIVDVPGTYDENKNTIICNSPKWHKHATAYLSVSLNGQQFSKVIPYKYESTYFSLHLMHFVYAIIGVVVAVVIVVITVVVFRHFNFKKIISLRAVTGGEYKIINDDSEVHNTIDEILFQECIGRGHFSEVHKAIWRGSVVAVKKFTPHLKINDKFLRAFEMEVCTMRVLRSPNIIQFLGSFYSPPDVGIITEYMANGSLFSVLHNPEIALPWHVVFKMLSDAARGMHYLHTCKPSVLHRDLKSPNLLVDEFLRVKVCDFGLSTVCKDGNDAKQRSLAKINENDQCEFGSLYWTAPEVLEGSSFTIKSDVYSFGIILWECATRCEPYNGIPSFKVVYSVCTEKERPQIPSELPQQYTKLMVACWDQNPKERPEFAAILSELENMESLGWKGQPTTTIDGKIQAKVENILPVDNLSFLVSDAGVSSDFSSSLLSSSSSLAHQGCPAILISP